jgi:major vault protein
MAEDRRDGGDMVLAPNEFMYVSDQTKGHVDVFVGPTKQSLSNTDQPVTFDDRTKRFIPVERDNAKQLAKTAPEGWYIVLKNPARDGKQPQSGGKVGSAALDVGKKIIIPGPASFSLWPGQMAKILKGHHLRSNQYLLVRVYDEEEARKNWKQAVIKRATTAIDPTGTPSPDKEAGTPDKEVPPDVSVATEPSKLTMGQTIVIKGTDVSFYIPPTGIEVIPDTDVLDADGNPTLVREAVTLERLEYCLLMDEQGSKRYERGPNVVFPEPTEVFVTEGQIRKFKAIQLSENSGIYIQVIAPYTDEKGAHKVGEELFITGKQQMIYFPREEHAIIKYDNNETHYAISIPAGEARYVLDRNTCIVSLIKGPAMFLPDPRTQVIVRRILPYKICSLLFPNNTLAFAHNAKLAGVDLDTYTSSYGADVVSAAAAAAPAAAMNFMASLDSPRIGARSIGSSALSRGISSQAGTKSVGDEIQRKTKYTEPRSHQV